MRFQHLLFALAPVILTMGLEDLRAADLWTAVIPAKLDARITEQIQDLARQRQVELRISRSIREATRGRATLVIILQQEENPSSLLNALRQISQTSGMEITPELAQEGYLLEAAYAHPSPPSHIRITASTATGFHHALLRVGELMLIEPRNLSTDLRLPAKSIRVEANGRQVVMADYPSFPERGVVEGFYGDPWSHQDRLDILRFEGQHRMTVYYYAPKDDPYHRKLWGEPYPPAEVKRLAELTQVAKANFVDFCFAISPGLSMVYSSNEDFAKLTRKLGDVAKLGVSCFALFLDDVPQDLQHPEDQARLKTLAQAHVDLINRLDRHLKSHSSTNRLVVTPTVYTDEWGSRDYVRELGAGTSPDVNIVWTGSEVVSPTITAQQANEWAQLLNRKPLVWDNFPVNDGIPWRVNLGPLRDRDPNLPGAIRGHFSNPMNQAHASMIPLQTIADYLWNSLPYDPERSHRKAFADQYGKDAADFLRPFLDIYGDYWWQENVFEPVFEERRYPIDLRGIEKQLARLDLSLESLRQHRRFEKLLAELSPFPTKIRDRLKLVVADPAFRLLPDQKLQWREDYDVLYAPRADELPELDGDFTKWTKGPLYALSQGSQIVEGTRHWKGPQEFSARVALAWDERYLYLGVDVRDPKLYQPFHGRGIDNGDAVILTLETAFRKNFESIRADGDEYRLFFSPGNFAGVEPSIFSDEDYLPPRPHPRDYAREIKTAWMKTPEGFSGDIAIPVFYFDGGVFRGGYEIGLSVGAQKVLPPKRAGGEAESQRVVFSLKGDRLFPVKFNNPSSYPRLVLIDPRRP